jgi:hypothetical protein
MTVAAGPRALSVVVGVSSGARSGELTDAVNPATGEVIARARRRTAGSASGSAIPIPTSPPSHDHSALSVTVRYARQEISGGSSSRRSPRPSGEAPSSSMSTSAGKTTRNR